MPKKKGRSAKHKQQNQTSGRRKDNRRNSSTSTSTDFNNEYNNDLFIGVDRLNLNEEDENFFRNLVLSNKVVSNNLQNKPKGLTNLGNTCYLNSTIQVLSQTPFFYEYLNKKADASVKWTAINSDYFKNLITNHDENINLDNYKLICKLGAPSILNSCLISLLHSLRSGLKSSSSIITPSNFVREISSSFNQFKNYNQQDSHEFLRCLLDTLRTNEINRQRKSILESFNLDNKKIKLLKDDDNLIKEIKLFSDSSNFTVIDSLFGGYCISSLKCEDCESTSQIFESFFDLSLPISNEENDNYHNNLNKKQHNQKLNQHNYQKDRKNLRIKVRNKKRINTKEIDNDDNEENEIDNDVSDNLENKNIKNLNTKERKLRRQLKKAAKRQIKKEIKLNDANVDKDDEKEDLDKKDDFDKKDDLDNFVNRKQIDNYDKQNQSSKQPKSSTLEDESDNESDSESDDEATSNEILKNELSSDNSKLDNLNELINKSPSAKHVQLQNSVDSGINSSNLNSEVDMNVNKIRNLVKTISPVHEEEITDNEQQQQNRLNENLNNNHHHQISDTNNKESDTGFEDRNGEADSEESNSLNIDLNDDDSDKENEKEDKTTNTVDNDVFKEINNEEKKSIRSSSAMENSELFKRKIKWTLSTISKRKEASILCSVLSGLARFTKIELLVGANKIFCESCTTKFKNKNGVSKKIYTNASKQMLIALPPPILTLHLKRFEVNNRSLTLSKLNNFVHFPLSFDLSPYVSNVYKVLSDISYNNDLNTKGRNIKSIIYSLYGIIEHSGSLRSGHYKCYVKLNNKESTDLQKFIRLQPYVPKISDLMDLITLDDIEKDEEDQQLNEMLSNMNLEDIQQQLNGNLNEEQSNSNTDAMNKIKEELIRATKEKWFHISDSSVQQVQLKNVLKAQAYLLFYERRY